MKVFIKALETYYVNKYGEDIVCSNEFAEKVLLKKYDDWFEVDFDYRVLSYSPPERETNCGGETEYEILWDKSLYTDEENKIITENFDAIAAEIENQLMLNQE